MEDAEASVCTLKLSTVLLSLLSEKLSSNFADKCSSLPERFPFCGSYMACAAWDHAGVVES